MSDTPKAILFGAIGTLTETSDMQRRAFNAAFRDAGLDWAWGREQYLELLKAPGGAARVRDYAEAKGVEVDAEAIHRAKEAHFRALAEKEGLELRPGVSDVIARARELGVKLGFVTTTGPDTVDLILEGLSDAINRRDFAYISDRDMVTEGKPSAEVYRLALAHLGLSAADVVAIEDTPESAKSPVAARIPCIGFPGEAARGRIFPDAVLHVVDRLEPVFCGISAS